MKLFLKNVCGFMLTYVISAWRANTRKVQLLRVIGYRSELSSVVLIIMQRNFLKYVHQALCYSCFNTSCSQWSKYQPRHYFYITLEQLKQALEVRRSLLSDYPWWIICQGTKRNSQNLQKSSSLYPTNEVWFSELSSSTFQLSLSLTSVEG